MVYVEHRFAFLQLLDQPETAQNRGNEFLRQMRQGQGLHQKFKFFLQASGSGKYVLIFMLLISAKNFSY